MNAFERASIVALIYTAINLLAAFFQNLASAQDMATNLNPVLATNLFKVSETGHPLFTVLGLSTNRFTNVVRTIQVEAINSACPECNGPNHHERRIDYMVGFDQIYLTVVARGLTNRTLIATGATNYWVATNLQLRVTARLQPGWTAPPMPGPL